jgi:Flp pilus assembly protein TadG
MAIRTDLKNIAGKLGRKYHRLLSRFSRHDDGAAMVEFAMVATPFLALMFAIIQTSLVFFAGQVLETATADSARLIMTGQAQTAGYDQAAFKQQVCAKITGLFSCSGIYVDVKTYSNFGAITNTMPVDANGNFTNNFTYQPGAAGDIVVVRLIYQFPIYVNLLGSTLSNMNGNKRIIVATAAFRNEPYSGSGT